jgi:7,8-dihydroneopterin aldolase/epimerase/oxygenase
MNKILIEDLSVLFHVGVPDEERSRPQRLLICLELERDFSRAVASDDLAHTLDYHALIQRIGRLGNGRSWKLIETLAWEIAGIAVNEFGASNALVTLKKFILPETRYVAVQVRRQSATPS